jgi:glycogen operon protein
MHWEGLAFDLPPVPGKTWVRVVDTSLPSPDDIVDLEQASVVPGEKCAVGGRSIVVLASRPMGNSG